MRPARAAPSSRHRPLAVLAVVSGAALSATAPARAEPAEVVLEVVASSPSDLADAAAATVAAGGDVVASAPGVLLVSVPPAARDDLAADVDGEVREPVAVDVRPQGLTPAGSVDLPQIFGPTSGSQVGITGADVWHDAGIDGDGLRVGVIDFFDTAYWNELEHGSLPVAGGNALCLNAGADCTDEFFDGVDLGGEDHGVAVVEIVLDMAPGAEIFIGQAGTITDYYALVDWFASNDVRIVNRSLGSRFDGPGDGRGLLDEVVGEAVSRGILWVNSGGNNGAERYYRHPVRLVGDRVAFGPSGTQTFLPFNGCVALGGVRWANDWDLAAADRTDYDVYLWESPVGAPGAGRIIDVSTSRQRQGADPVETQIGSFCPAPGSTLHLEVQWLGGDTTGDVLEILDYGAGMSQFTQRPFSAAVSVVDSHERGVVAVGAIDPPGGGQIADYSSEGPTNDGRIAPHVTAPSGFISSVFGTFSGTSASAPVVAGGAALLLDAGLAVGPGPLGDLIRNSTVDRGAAGPDNIYGHGEFRLPVLPDSAGIDERPSGFVPLDAPTRFLDTRPLSAVGPSDLIGSLWRGERLDLPVVGVAGIPSGDVTAVAVNVVSVAPDRSSYVQVLPTRQAALGAFANLNADTAGETRSNFAVVPVGDDGRISIYSIAEGDIVVDVLGWFEAADAPTRSGRFVELDASERLVDTRIDGAATPVASGDQLEIPLPTGVDPNQISALIATVVAVSPTERGWLQAYPADRPDAIGATATINVVPGVNVANTAIVPVGAQGVAVTGRFAGAGTAHVVVDAIGYITSDAAPLDTVGRFVPVRPGRAFDSRPTAPLDDAEVVTIDASDAPDVAVPDAASAAIWNLVIVDADRRGYLRGWAADRPEPTTSSLNWTRPGETRSGAAVTAVDAGRARFRIEDGTIDAVEPVGDLVVDVFGYFS